MEVFIDLQARRRLERLPVSIKVRVLDIFMRLARWPQVSGAKPLRGRLAGQYRMRTGDDRVQFRVEPNRIVIVHIGHREGFYHDQD
jgi:mRNA-degrading endonuclease RelE of RelBE toxin-antitoxin system